MKDLSWDNFSKKIHINTTVEKLYWCWATQEGITSWFLRDAEYIRNGHRIAAEDFIKSGDNYVWQWHNWDGKEQGNILEANGVDKLVLSFADSCKLIITLEPREDSVLLTLTQSEIPLDEKSKLQIFYGCSNGWTFWLANLKAYLEHGILLNETKIDLRGFDLAGYEFVNM